MIARHAPSSARATPRQLDNLLAELEQPRKRPDWRRSERGNLYRSYRGKRLVVFRRSGCWAWLVCDGEKVRYSPGLFSSEDKALTNVWREVNRE